VYFESRPFLFCFFFFFFLFHPQEATISPTAFFARFPRRPIFQPSLFGVVLAFFRFRISPVSYKEACVPTLLVAFFHWLGHPFGVRRLSLPPLAARLPIGHISFSLEKPFSDQTRPSSSSTLDVPLPPHSACPGLRPSIIVPPFFFLPCFVAQSPPHFAAPFTTQPSIGKDSFICRCAWTSSPTYSASRGPPCRSVAPIGPRLGPQ